MIKVKLTNRLKQALPVLLRDLDNPKNLRQVSIPKKRSKLIKEEELTAHCQDLVDRGYLVITKSGGVSPLPAEGKLSAKAEEKKEVMREEPIKVAAPALYPKANKKSSRSHKKGRK